MPDPKFNDKIAGEDPGAPKNPNIGKKFIYTTIITSIIFVGIYYMVINDFLNLREFFKNNVFIKLREQIRQERTCICASYI